MVLSLQRDLSSLYMRRKQRVHFIDAKYKASHPKPTWQHIFSGVAILGFVYFEGAGGSWRATVNGGIQFLK